MADKPFGPERHLEELGLDPAFRVEEAKAVLRDLDERLEEARERRRAIEEQRREKREEVTAAKGGRVVADLDDDEEETIEYMHLNLQIDLWGRKA